jgi:N-acetylneuraminic acid mutarotase
MGGATDAGLQNVTATVPEYDPKTDQWTKKANMPTEKYGLSASVVNGKIYAIGGWNDLALSTVEEYNPRTDTWTQKADMPEARYALSTSTVNGRIYAIAGATDVEKVGNNFEYDPATNPSRTLGQREET